MTLKNGGDMVLKTTEDIPRRICTDNRLKQLRKSGYNTTGYDREMEKILKDKGYNLPVQIENESWKFQAQGYTRITLTRADCLAEALILIKEIGL